MSIFQQLIRQGDMALQSTQSLKAVRRFTMTVLGYRFQIVVLQRVLSLAVACHVSSLKSLCFKFHFITSLNLRR